MIAQSLDDTNFANATRRLTASCNVIVKSVFISGLFANSRNRRVGFATLFRVGISA